MRRAENGRLNCNPGAAVLDPGHDPFRGAPLRLDALGAGRRWVRQDLVGRMAGDQPPHRAHSAGGFVKHVAGTAPAAVSRIPPALPEKLGGDSRIDVGESWGSSPALLIASLRFEEPVLCLVASMSDAEDTVGDLAAFGVEAALYPEYDAGDRPDPIRQSERLRALRNPGRVIVTTLRGAVESAEGGGDPLALARGKRIRPREIADALLGAGYRRVGLVESPGEFAVRGGVLDLFPLASERPLRIEFDGDDVAEMRFFCVEDQSSTEPIESIEVPLNPIRTPAWEGADLLDRFPRSAVFRWDPLRMEEGWRRFANPPQWAGRLERVSGKIVARRGADLYPLPVPSGVSLGAAAPPRFSPATVPAPVQLRQEAERFEVVHLYCPTEAERDRIAALIREQGGEIPNLSIAVGRLSRGFTLQGSLFLPHHELFAKRPLPRLAGPSERAAAAADLDVERGDPVVHRHFGVGRFLGFERVAIGGTEGEAAVIQYADGIKIHVPAHDFGLLEKYVADRDAAAPLSKPGTAGWRTAKEEARRAIVDFARELVSVQAKRGLVTTAAVPRDPELQELFEGAFPYEETQDQLRAAEEIRRDLASGRPADRLLCGDVGFGKTELAMRAAFQVVTSGRQAAVLCPTTVLALQHWKTFRDRMADYPVRVAALSRLQSGREQRETLAGLERGEVDIVIGTHRLLQPDVRFRDLGLLIVDEEQRFGVEQKEALKKMRATLHVLSLSATPIPRTLHMALMSIRDISVLSTAPSSRRAVVTEVGPYDEGRIRAAIRRELERGGQVYYVHNRVETIHRTADRLREIVPEARIAVGHGQMGAEELEDTMVRFVNGEIDVLVATSIIENGIDIPNANTLIVDNADWFGLSDLHQLRGRVGRHHRQAHAIFLLPKDRPLTPEAARRLEAIEEMSELGAGFRIAMRDMEIRGVGNLLGKEQHGHIRAVGFDLYLEMLHEEIARLRGETAEPFPDAAVQLLESAMLPEGWIPDLPVRVAVYREIGRARSLSEIERIRGRLRDRFGPIPEEARRLLWVQALKVLLARRRCPSLTETANYALVKYADAAEAERLRRRAPERVRIVDDSTMILTRCADGVQGWIELLADPGEPLPHGLGDGVNRPRSER